MIVAEVCYRCEHPFSLGPANDTPAVAIEVRAAEVAAKAEADAWARHRMDRGTGPSREAWGWYSRVNGSMPRGTDLELAGYLAHAIAHHEEEQLP